MLRTAAPVLLFLASTFVSAPSHGVSLLVSALGGGGTPAAVFELATPEYTVIRTVFTVPQDFEPRGLAVIGDDLVVSISGEGRRYDLRTGQLLGDFAPGVQLGALQVGPNGDLFSMSFDDPILRIDPATGTVLDSIGSGLYGDDFAFGPDGALYTTGSTGLERWDPDSGAFLGTVLANSPDLSLRYGILAFAPDGRLFAQGFDDYGGVLLRIDRETGAILARQEAPPNLFDMVFDPVTGILLGAGDPSPVGALTRIDPTTLSDLGGTESLGNHITSQLLLIPEPGSLALVALGLGILVARRRC